MNIGDIFYFDVGYEDDPSEFKKRPVLLLSEDEDNILFMVATTSRPRNHPFKWYDHKKIPINNWRRIGLSKPSWCLAGRLISLPRAEVEPLVKEEDYIGKINQYDFNKIIEAVERLHA